MSYIKKNIKWACAFSFTSFISMCAVAHAETASWEKVCNNSSSNKVCNTVRDVVTPYGQPLAIFNVIQKDKQKILQITVPTARHIPEGISFQIGKGDVKKLDYSYCLPSNCVAQGDIDDNIIKALKTNDKIKIISINFQGQSNPVEVSLHGFKKAYDSGGITEKEFMKRRSKLADDIASKEEKTSEKLIEAQQKLKH